MLTYKCAHCASAITVEDNQRIGQCPVCGSIFVFPNQYAAKTNLYRLASDALYARNFDVALNYYSRILKVDATETAAHWGYLLSKYGIDLYSHGKSTYQILFHRLERISFMDDPSYEKMITYCPAEARYYYEGLSRQIVEKQHKLWAIAEQVGQYDIYINCIDDSGTTDYMIANQVGKTLDDAGYRVFLPCTMLRSVPDAEKNMYEIAVAEKAKSMIVVMTKQTKRKAARYEAVWKRFLAYHKQDVGRKMLSVYQNLQPDDLPLELQPLQSLEFGNTNFQHVVLTEINKMFGHQKQNVLVTREILEKLRAGQNHLESGHYADAKICFEQVLKLDVDEAQAQWGLICVATENLTKPVLSDEFDMLYQRVLQLDKGEVKEKHRAMISRLMTESAWEALLHETDSLRETNHYERKSVVAAIDRVYLYMPKGDVRLQQIAVYCKNGQMEKEAKEILDSYCNRNVVEQPLFAEQQKAENEYQAVKIGNLRALDNGYIWLFGYVLSFILLMISQFQQIAITRVIAGPRDVQADKSLGEVLLAVGTMIFVITFLYMCKKEKRTYSFKMVAGIGFVVTSLVLVLSLIFYEAIHLLVLALPFIAILVLTLMVMQDNRILKSYRNKIKKIESVVLDIDKKIAAAYQERMKAHYKKYKQPDHAVPAFQVPHTQDFRMYNICGQNQGNRFFLLNVIVVLAAAILIPTFVSNMLYAGKWKNIVEITGNDYHVVGLKEDGTVVANGANYREQCEVSEWKDIVKVIAGGYFTVGLKADGTVVTTDNNLAFYDIKEWKDVVDISVGRNSILALTKDGTCLAAEIGNDGAEEVQDFKDIVAVHAVRLDNINGSVGLTSDGHLYLTDGWGDISKEIEDVTGSSSEQVRVMRVYDRGSGLILVGEDGEHKLLEMEDGGSIILLEGWNEMNVIKAIGGRNSLGLLSDGTIKYVGYNDIMADTVAKWTDIVDIDGRAYHFLGLHADGSVVTVGMNDYGQGEVEDWNNITKILALGNTSFGVKEDGTVVASGRNVCDMTYVSNKNPIELIQFWWSATQWNNILNGRG